jgi:uncharacterized protein
MSNYYDLSINPANKQRRPENRRDDKFVKGLLRRYPVCRIATRWGNQPFITPTNFVYDETNNRIIFHSNVVGRLRANSEKHDEVCLEVTEFGKYLPSNDPLEFSTQYRSVIVFGKVQGLEHEAAREALYKLIPKYFPGMAAGREYKPITEQQLKQTSVYEILIESWSGKENWEERAIQVEDWPALDKSWFEKF